MKLSDELHAIANKINEDRVQYCTNKIIEHIHKICMITANEGDYQLSVYITEISAQLHSLNLNKDYVKYQDQVIQNVLKRLQENFTEFSYKNDSKSDDDAYILIKW